MDFAERGMNGTLACVRRTGMPMRPAMSVMLTAEVPATDAQEAGLDVRLGIPTQTVPGRPARIVATV